MSVAHPSLGHPPSVVAPPVQRSSASPLSPRAELLLQTFIRLGAFDAANAVTDARLAKMTGIPKRDVIDVRDELLDAGHLVVARTVKPKGSFIDMGIPASEESGHYQDSLESRGKKILVRASRVGKIRYDRNIIAKPMDDRGQATLGLQFEQPRAKRLEAFQR